MQDKPATCLQKVLVSHLTITKKKRERRSKQLLVFHLAVGNAIRRELSQNLRDMKPAYLTKTRQIIACPVPKKTT